MSSPGLWPDPLQERLLNSPLSSDFDSLSDAEVLLQKAESACRRDGRVSALLGDDMCVDLT